QEIATSPALAALPELEVVAEADRLREFMTHFPGGRLRALSLWGREATALRGIDAASWQGLSRLARLSPANLDLGDATGQALFRSPNLGMLHRLNLGPRTLAPRMLAAVADSERLAGLRSLCLDDYLPATTGASALAGARWPLEDLRVRLTG